MGRGEIRLSNNTTAVRIDKQRHSEIKLYAAFKGVSIFEVVDNALDRYLYESEDFREFRERYLLPEKEKSITVSAKQYEKLLTIAKENDIELK